MHLAFLGLGCFVFEFSRASFSNIGFFFTSLTCLLFRSSQDTQREHLSKILQMLSSVSPGRFVPFERQICVS